MDPEELEDLSEGDFFAVVADEIRRRYPKASRVVFTTTYGEHFLEIDSRSAKALKEECISMKSLDGQFIK